MKIKGKISGPLGFWKFPFINKFMGPKYSIRDHKVISGKPDYIDDFTILLDGESVPWEIEFAYDTKVKVKRIDDRTGRLIYESPVTKMTKGQRFRVPPNIADTLRSNRQHMFIEQVEPR